MIDNKCHNFGYDYYDDQPDYDDEHIPICKGCKCSLLFEAGELLDTRMIYYCKVCGWRGFI